MARAYTVIPLWEALRLERRNRLGIAGEVIVEEKIDGILLVAYDGGLYTGSGRRAPRHYAKALEEAGAGDALLYSKSNKVLYMELYGKCVPGEYGIYHLSKWCYRAALLDVGVTPTHAGPILEALSLVKIAQPTERMSYAENVGIDLPKGFSLRRNSILDIVKHVPVNPSSEGVVVKLYKSFGHILPPDYGAKYRGELAFKVKWVWFKEKWR